jgi:hypothetical protein
MAETKDDHLESFWDEDEEFLKDDAPGKKETKEEVKGEESFIEEEEEIVEETEEVETPDPIKDFLTGLSSVGLLPETDEEITPEAAIEAIILNTEQYIEQGVSEVIESWKEDIGERGVEFAKFVKAGGNPDDYFKAYAQDHLQFDVSSERGQEAFLTWYYSKHDEMDEEDIEDRLLSLRDKEKTGDTAKRLYSKLKDKRDKEAQEIVKSQLAKEEKQRAATRKEQERLLSGLQKVDSFGELKINKLEKPVLINFIARPSETYDGQRVTGVTKAMNELYDKPEALMAFAKWAKSGFDKSFFSKESSAAKKETKRDFKPQPKKKSVLDYFD